MALLPSFCPKDGWFTPNNRFQIALGEAYCIACAGMAVEYMHHDTRMAKKNIKDAETKYKMKLHLLSNILLV